MKSVRGFSLVEVLVASVLVSMSLIGVVSLQIKSIQYAQESTHRNLAISLTDELVEIIRSHRYEFLVNVDGSDSPYYYLNLITGIYKENGSITMDADKCNGVKVQQYLIEQANCWLKLLESSLPGVQGKDVKSKFRICPSHKPGQCASAGYKGSTLELEIAWRGREGECEYSESENICTHAVRFEL